MAKIIKITEEQYNLLEGKPKLVTGFHGSNANFENFDYNYLGIGNDQYGPGFYFFNNYENASKYGKFVYECNLNLDKQLSKQDGSKPKMSHLKFMINRMGKNDKQNLASNYSEYMQIGMREAINSIYKYSNDEHDAFLEVWINGYVKGRNHDRTEGDFCKNLSELGYGGVVITDYGPDPIYVMFNIDKITIQQKHIV